MRGEANPAGGQRKPPSTDAEKQAAAQQFMQAARSGRMSPFGGRRSGAATPAGGEGMAPTTDAEKQAAAQRFMSGARSVRMSPFGGGKSGIAIPMAERGMKKGGSVSASKRADGCAKKGKTKGRMV
jgi:hypothetical protein